MHRNHEVIVCSANGGRKLQPHHFCRCIADKSLSVGQPPCRKVWGVWPERQTARPVPAEPRLTSAFVNKQLESRWVARKRVVPFSFAYWSTLWSCFRWCIAIASRQTLDMEAGLSHINLSSGMNCSLTIAFPRRKPIVRPQFTREQDMK